MYCYKCAKELPEASAYCPICGAKLESKGIKLSGDAELKYVIENLEIRIVKFVGTASIVEIPNEINGLRVTSIGFYAFANAYSLKSVVIPDSVCLRLRAA